jgi:NDP-sugar pyrophosphorylase family protein
LVKPVVLCGGEGSRLRPLTYYFQKAMIPVGREQRPLLEYILRHIRFHGFMEAVLLVGYKGEQVVNYFEDGGRVGAKAHIRLGHGRRQGNMLLTHQRNKPGSPKEG